MRLPDKVSEVVQQAISLQERSILSYGNSLAITPADAKKAGVAPFNSVISTGPEASLHVRLKGLPVVILLNFKFVNLRAEMEGKAGATRASSDRSFMLRCNRK